MMLFKHYMSKHRWNYNTLSEALGVSRVTIANWDKGNTSPNMKQFQKLCRLLDVSPNDLYNEFVDLKKGEKINDK